jgi:hypothetical protein
MVEEWGEGILGLMGCGLERGGFGTGVRVLEGSGKVFGRFPVFSQYYNLTLVA